MATQKIKIKVTKKKINIKNTITIILLFFMVALTVVYVIHKPIKNIYISGNTILSDKEIIDMAGIKYYPPFINTYFINIKSKLLKNEYIRDVKIIRKKFSKIYIEIEEYKPLCIYHDKLLLSSKSKVDNKYNIDYVPYLSNSIEEIYDKFVDSFKLIDNNILVKISHIEYAPNDVDKERFILYMTDNNYVHITLSKIEKINKYNSVINELEGQKGIIYLDSGDYVEIKD